MRRPLRAVALLAAAGATALVVLPVGIASAAPRPVAITAAAWYQPNPSGLPVPAESPYPAGTMHVGAVSSNETARTYLALGPYEPFVAGTLVVPLDSDVTSGSSSPEQALIQLCTVAGPIASVEGSYDSPPAADCSLGVPMVYEATPVPRLVGSLDALAARLSAGATGLALVPQAPLGSTSSWQVAFWAPGAAPSPSLAPTLTVDDGVHEVVVPSPTPEPSEPVEEPSLPPYQPLPLPATPVQAPPPSAPPTPVVASPTPATRVVVVSAYHPYRYPLAWSLPLLVAAGVWGAARALARPVSPAGPPRG